MSESLENLKPLIITDARIINFYNKNKELDITKMNLLYIELFESVLNASFDNSSTVNKIMMTLNNQNNDLQNIISSIKYASENNKMDITSIKEMHSLNMENIKNEMNNLKSSLSGITSTMINKIYETKDSYINEIKNVFKTADIENNNNIGNILDKQNSILLDKITISLNDIIPKTQQQSYNNILIDFKKDLVVSLEELHKLNPDKLLDNIHTIVNNKYDNLSKLLNDNILQTEQRLNTNILQLNEIVVKNICLQENTHDELTKYLNKYNNSSQKGNLGENQLYRLLIDAFPTGEIINTSNFTGQGDFKLNRKNYNSILIETKDYTDNVKISETEKFLRDCTNNNCNGIFISQNSGIVNKNNYQIDIHNGKILIYIHNMNYDKYKLCLGVNIIDLLNEKLVLLNEKTINLPPDILKNINDEYQIFLTMKDRMIVDLKDYYKKSMDNFMKLNLPELEKLLVKYFANIKKIKNICDICNKYESESLKSLARHKTICKKKHNNIDSKEISSEDKSNE